MRSGGGSPPDRARIELRQKSRLDLRGIPAAGARLLVSVKPFREKGVPQRVKAVSERIHWAAAPPSG